MRKLVYSPNGWLDYIHWQKTDKKVRQAIDKLALEICEEPFEGRGSPIQLKFDLSDIWTRRVDFEHRIVYRVTSDAVQVLQCYYHH